MRWEKNGAKKSRLMTKPKYFDDTWTFLSFHICHLFGFQPYFEVLYGYYLINGHVLWFGRHLTQAAIPLILVCLMPSSWLLDQMCEWEWKWRYGIGYAWILNRVPFLRMLFPCCTIYTVNFCVAFSLTQKCLLRFRIAIFILRHSYIVAVQLTFHNNYIRFQVCSKYWRYNHLYIYIVRNDDTHYILSIVCSTFVFLSLCCLPI